MSDDTITFLSTVCCAVAFTVALFAWHPSQDVSAGTSEIPIRVMTP